jgi:UrcA family protein
MPRPLITATAALALAALGCGASAQDRAQNGAHYSISDSAMTVRFADLNLSSDTGAQAALHRIKNSAAAFCGEENARDLAVIAAQKDCVAQMSAKAVGILDVPRVTALAAPTLGTVVLAGGPP